MLINYKKRHNAIKIDEMQYRLQKHNKVLQVKK